LRKPVGQKSADSLWLVLGDYRDRSIVLLSALTLLPPLPRPIGVTLNR